MKPNVFWYGDCRGSWCHAIVEWLTAECEHATGLTKMDPDNPAVVVIKADQIKTHQELTWLNQWLKPFPAVLLFVTANEEGTFDPERIQHHRVRMWIQTPTRAQRQWASCGIPWGWTPGFDGSRWSNDLPGYRADEADRMLDFSFCGQVTHVRRADCVAALQTAIQDGYNGTVLRTAGFGQGLPRHLYFELLMNSKSVPCPSGPITLDTFRVWEALECGAIPVVDGWSPATGADEADYWDYIAGPDHPLRVVRLAWDLTMPEHLRIVKAGWNELQPLLVSWWAKRKQFWKDKFAKDLEMLTVR